MVDEGGAWVATRDIHALQDSRHRQLAQHGTALIGEGIFFKLYFNDITENFTLL
jgi:hypothetical protein